MKKVISLLLIMTMILSLSSLTYADIIYNEETDTYISTSIEDGVLAFGGTVYHPDGTIYGQSKGDGRYLENMIPSNIITSQEKTQLQHIEKN